MKLPKRAWRVYRNEGARGVFERTRWFGSQLLRYHWYAIYERSFENGFDLLSPPLVKAMRSFTKTYELEWITEDSRESLPSYLAYRQLPRLSEEEALGWLRAGHATVLVRDGKRIIGDCWLALKSFPFPAQSQALVDRMERLRYAYSFMVYVDPDYRGRGVFPMMLEAHTEVLRREGRRGLVGIVLKRSESSRRTIEQLGFKRTGKLHIFTVLGRRYAKAALHAARGRSLHSTVLGERL